jgi:hypothetical protein
MPRSISSVVVVAALSLGCAVPRAVFPAMPGTAAALGDREAFYEEHRSLDVVGTPNAAQQLGWATDPRFPMLVLADGQQVSNVRDLVPVVDPSSPTAKAIAAADDAAFAADVAWSASLIGMTTGLLIAASSPLFLVDGDEQLGATFATYLGGSALALVSAFTVGIAEFRRHGLVRPRPARAPWAAPGAHRGGRCSRAADADGDDDDDDDDGPCCAVPCSALRSGEGACP